MVSGGPQLRLTVGDAARWAGYAHPEDVARLIFSYSVNSDDADADGVSIGENGLNLNGGDILDGSGNAAQLNHPALSDQSGHKVGGDPVVESGVPEGINLDDFVVGGIVDDNSDDTEGDAEDVLNQSQGEMRRSMG